MADVNIIVGFDPDSSKHGEKRTVDAQTARIMVAEGTAQYATEAQERKADPLKKAEKADA